MLDCSGTRNTMSGKKEERRWEIARLRLRDEVHLGHVSVYSSDGRKPADYWMYHSFDTEAHLFRYGKTDLEHLMCVDCVEGSGQAALADIENVTAPATSEGSVADTTVLSNSKEPDKLTEAQIRRLILYIYYDCLTKGTQSSQKGSMLRDVRTFSANSVMWLAIRYESSSRS